MRLNGRILVAGASGFIGANLVHRLRKAGHRVRAHVHEASTPRLELLFPEQGAELEVVRGDLRKLDSCRGITEGCEFVFMCAANTAGAAVMTRTPLVHVTPNVVMNTHLLEAAYENSVSRFVFLSSGAAYPDTGERAAKESDMFTGEPYPAYHAVAWMKRYTEILCKTYSLHCKEPMSTVVVRPSNIFGPWDKFDPETSHVTASLIRRIVNEEDPFEIWGTGEDIRDLLYIDDFLEGLLKASEWEDPFYEVNICSGIGVRVREILEAGLRVSKHEPAVQYDPSKPSTIPVRRMSNEKALKDLQFEATHSLEQGLAKTIDWYREYRERWER